MAFGRIIEVLIGPPGQTGLKIDGLRMTFDIEKDSKPTPNKASLKIFNMSKDNAKAVAKAGNSLVINAGYADEMVGGLFFGDIITAWPHRDGSDYILEIDALDGIKDLQAKTIALSYSEGTVVADVANQILNVMAMAVKGKEKLDTTITYPTGYTFIGKAKDALTEVLRRLGLKFSVQNGIIYIIKDDEGADQTGLLLTTSTGLLVSPEILQDNSQQVGTTTQSPTATKPAPAPNRWKLRTLMFPQIVPGAYVQVQSPVVETTLLIEKAKYAGDNWDGPFTIEAEALEAK